MAVVVFAESVSASAKKRRQIGCGHHNDTSGCRHHWRRLGLSDERILEHHPDLNSADLETAWAYYHQQPNEIEQTIREDEDA
jgi:hypothetical protein